MRRVLFVPLDDRPATRQTVLDLLPLTGAAWATPPRDLLGSRRRPADLDVLWQWIETEATSADALVASAEMLIHGGLVPSRMTTEPLHVLWQRLDRLAYLAARVRTYLGAVNPRIPTGASDEEPDYWRAHGDLLRAYSSDLDAGEQSGNRARVRRAEEALERLPAMVAADLLSRRQRHLLLNLELILLASRGTVAALLIGQDDAEPYGLARADLAVLRRFRDLADGGRAHVSVGADELGARLLARLVTDTAGRAPRVRVRYTFPSARPSIPRYEPWPLEETVASHLEAAGCVLAKDAPDRDAPDILLWVHNFPGERQEEAVEQPALQAPPGAAAADGPPPLVQEVVAALAEAAGRGMVCGLADVRYANGADDALVRALLAAEDLAGLAGYAGWNTCSNSLGTVIAQVVLAAHARHHLDAAAFRRIRRRYLARRLLDDWGYQVHVRPYLGREVIHRFAAAGGLAEAAVERMRREIVPAVAESLGPLSLAGLAFPWGRPFEVDVRLDDDAEGV